MDPSSDFQKSMVEYLESVHCGEFMQRDITSGGSDVQKANEQNPFRIPPTEKLPEVSPNKCEHEYDDHCNHCRAYNV